MNKKNKNKQTHFSSVWIKVQNEAEGHVKLLRSQFLFKPELLHHHMKKMKKPEQGPIPPAEPTNLHLSFAWVGRQGAVAPTRKQHVRPLRH